MAIHLVDGSSDWIDLGQPNSLSQGESAMTITGHYYFDNNNESNFIDLSRNTASTSRLEVRRLSGGAIRGGGRAPDSDSFQSSTSSGTIPQQTYVNLANVFNVANDDYLVYEDGASFHTDNSFGFTNAAYDNTTSQHGGIGTEADGTPVKSDFIVEDKRLYNRELSAAEIATIDACQGHDGIVYGLVAHYRMDELPSGTTATNVTDYSGNKTDVSPISSPSHDNIRLSYRKRV